MTNPPFARPGEGIGRRLGGYTTVVEGLVGPGGGGNDAAASSIRLATSSADNNDTGSTSSTALAPAAPPADDDNNEGSGLWSHVRTFRVSMVIFPLFFIANFSYNVSLAHTSVTSNTIISTTSSLWTFLFR